ncbi:hypothetical protein RHGRI_034877 [Rhododendron griersonianum]|uniref:TORTIFOLIA1/SINE1-2 N-terminal domain-containing protein n=1 Tax=Rhododendron griersonianum TaxID=479676 RepID=A0AAV6I2I1_9ERIC|nr:hypothetical protein RHGRI_034877 [Rhododendron griersonianum]
MAEVTKASTRDLNHRVLTCLHKLSDRDTHSAAASELESIAKTLPPASLPPFLSSISATDTSDKSPVRAQCLRLISLLSASHGDALSPHLSKLLSSVLRRLRDPDSSVRSACEVNSQTGAALCLAAAIDGSPDPEPAYLKKLLPRLEKLVRCEGFKAKAAVLRVIGSVIGAGGASSHQTVRSLVPCLVEVIGKSDDWAARKAAAEALVKLAVVEGEMLTEFKASCLKTFEAKRFDKVKIVRETMNQLVEDASDRRSPHRPKTSVPSRAPQMRKKSMPTNKPSLPDSIATPACEISPLDGRDMKSGPAIFRKLDKQKPTGSKIKIAAAHTPSTMVDSGDDSESIDEKGDNARSRFANPKGKRAPLKRNGDNKMLKFGGVRAGCRVDPCYEESSGSTVGNVLEDVYGEQKECEDLSLIRTQLLNIENQQSSLLDLLQKFMGSSQNGMLSLETRVQGLELALDEISYDLAMSTGRMSKVDSAGSTCCKLPGGEFLSPKFWRRTEPRNSISHFSPSRDTHPIAAPPNIANNGRHSGTFKLETRRLGLQRGHGFVVNPLAEIQSASHGISEVSSNRGLTNVRNAV